MTTRVFNPIFMSEMRKRLRTGSVELNAHSGVTLNLPERTVLDSVRRDLFGPVDHEDSRAFVERELAAQRTRDTDRWGFDFVKETPRKNGPGTSRYVWEKVKITDHVPESYALRRLAFITDHRDEKCEPSSSSETRTSRETDQSVESDSAAVCVSSGSKQTHITDFMKSRKRPFNSKLSNSVQYKCPVEPPSKMPATGEST